MEPARPKQHKRRVILQAALVGGAIGAYWARHRGGGSGRGPTSGGEGYFAGIHVPWLAYDTALQGFWPLLVAAVVLFVIFSVYWEVAARKAGVAKSSESSASRALHVFLTNAALLLELIPIHGLGRYVPASALIMSAGLAVQIAGLAVAIWARRHLGTNWSGRISIMAGHEIVRSGPYRVLRHPIYTGILAMYIGLALVTGEWLALIGLGLAGFAYCRKIRLEEAALDTAFGPDYAAYRRETWALVPGLF